MQDVPEEEEAEAKWAESPLPPFPSRAPRPSLRARCSASFCFDALLSVSKACMSERGGLRWTEKWENGKRKKRLRDKKEEDGREGDGTEANCLQESGRGRE
eukprot:3317707-Rhodomonas_salina.1